MGPTTQELQKVKYWSSFLLNFTVSFCFCHLSVATNVDPHPSGCNEELIRMHFRLSSHPLVTKISSITHRTVTNLAIVRIRDPAVHTISYFSCIFTSIIALVVLIDLIKIVKIRDHTAHRFDEGPIFWQHCLLIVFVGEPEKRKSGIWMEWAHESAE